jgi:hypothetical protein
MWLDLAQAESNLAWAAMRNRWSPSKVRIPLDAWEQYRDRLSVEIVDSDALQTVAGAMAVLAHIRAVVGNRYDREGDLPPGVGESVREARAAALRAAEVIRPIAGVGGLQRAPRLE